MIGFLRTGLHWPRTSSVDPYQSGAVKVVCAGLSAAPNAQDGSRSDAADHECFEVGKSGAAASGNSHDGIRLVSALDEQASCQ